MTAPPLIPFSTADLLAAHAAGLSAVEWHDRGRPVIASAPKPKRTRAKGGYRSSLEAAYAEHLHRLGLCGIIRSWQYEPRRFTIGIRRHYTPDFRVVVRIGLTRYVQIQYHEVKGSVHAKNARDSITRLHTVAMLHAHLTFVLVTRRGGEWIHQPVRAT